MNRINHSKPKYFQSPNTQQRVPQTAHFSFREHDKSQSLDSIDESLANNHKGDHNTAKKPRPISGLSMRTP